MTPCERLLVAVVARAIKDACGRNEENRLDAQKFLRSEAIESTCDWLSVYAQTVRRYIKFQMGTGGGDALHGERF